MYSKLRLSMKVTSSDGVRMTAHAFDLAANILLTDADRHQYRREQHQRRPVLKEHAFHARIDRAAAGAEAQHRPGMLCAPPVDCLVGDHDAHKRENAQ